MPSVEETEMEAVSIRQLWASRSAGGATITDAEAHSDRADLLGAFQACDVNGDGKIGATELHAILRAIGAQVELESVAEIMAEAERLTEEDEAHTAMLAAAGPPPPPSPAAKTSRDFTRPFAALTIVTDTLTDAARDVAHEVEAAAETVATAVERAAEEAAEFAGLMDGAAAEAAADRHDGKLDFLEFERLMKGPLLEPLLLAASARQQQSQSQPPREKGQGGDGRRHRPAELELDVVDTERPEVAADLVLLREHLLEEHAERLRQENLLGCARQKKRNAVL